MNAVFNISGKVIKTERLILRSFTQNDLNDFFEYAKVPGVGEMAGWSHHKDINESKTILDLFIKEDKTFAITLKDSGKVIGSLGIEKYEPEDKLTEFNGYIGREIGFVLSKDYWNKGYMTEACRAIIDYLLNELNYDFIICCHSDINYKSKHVQEKCGFKPYRKIVRTTIMGTEEPGVINLLINPNKHIKFIFSHHETLIWSD